MNNHRYGVAEKNGLPSWLNTTVVLVLLGTFVYNVVFVGPEGYPTNVIIGGLLGAYIGADQYLRRRNERKKTEEANDG